MSLRQVFAASVILGLLISVGGCASNEKAWAGPAKAANVTSVPWRYGPISGRRYTTADYVLYTTNKDDEFNQRVAQLMQGSLEQYRLLVPSAPQQVRPMDCFVFANRREWADFTQRRTGKEATVYLQINRGGYTIGDWFAAYYIGDNNTFSVASHEGWHQFGGRNFKHRLPPFLDEGIATTFENVSWTPAGLPRWDTSRNLARAQALRKAVEAKTLWPLTKIVAMHAGDVVDQPSERIEAFYAQNWSLARFLLEGEGGKYRPALQRLLADAVSGQMANPGGGSRSADAFNPQAVRPLLEHYLGQDLAALEGQYQAFCRQIAFERFNEQWNPG